MPKLRLDSWKSIADYLERSPRTVQRWHTSHGLPVHHFGGCKGSVFAYTQEIDRWLACLGEDARGSESEGDVAHETRKRRSHELTARATEMWETHSEENLNTIAGIYRKAIDQFPGNARALTGLANVMISASLQAEMDGSVAYPCATETLRRANQLNSSDLDGRCGQAWLNLVHGRKWRQARAGFEDVLSKQPRMSFALAGMALLHIAESDLTNASRCAWDAWMQNTLMSTLGVLVCWSKYLQGDFELTLELISQVRGSGGCGATIGAIEALALNQTGPSTAGIERIEEIAAEFPRSQTLQGALGYAYAVTKQTGKALDVDRNLDHPGAQKKPNNSYGRALVSIGLGCTRQAVPWLEAAYAEGSLWSLGFGSDPALKWLRGDPSFDALVQKIGSAGVRPFRTLHAVDFMNRDATAAVERRSDLNLASA